MSAIDEIDDALCELAVDLVNAVAKQHRVAPHHVALAVSGLCHHHGPDGRRLPGCAYCVRRGNVFERGHEPAGGR